MIQNQKRRSRKRRRNLFDRRGIAQLLVIAMLVTIFQGAYPLGMFSSNAGLGYASSSDAGRVSLENKASEDVQITVLSDNISYNAGDFICLDLYIKNNTDQIITDGLLKYSGKGIVEDSAYFEDLSDLYNSQNEDSAENGNLPAETKETESAEEEAARAARLAGLAETAGAVLSETIAEDDEEADFDQEHEDEEAPERLEELTIYPGQSYYVNFYFEVDSDIETMKAQKVDFKFTGKAGEDRVSTKESFCYNVGGMNLLPITFGEENKVLTGEQYEMTIGFDLGDVAEIIEEAEMDKELEEDAENESLATSSQASSSNAGHNLASSSNAWIRWEADEASTSNAKPEKSLVRDLNCKLETYGIRLNGFKEVKEEEDTGESPSAVYTFRVSSTTKPGTYYGRAMASYKMKGKTYRTSQGFQIIVTGDGNIQLTGKVGQSEVIVSGPADAFPEANELGITVSEVSEEQQAAVDEALKKKAETEGIEISRYRALDIKLYADGVEAEPSGDIQVKFKNVGLTETTQEDAPIAAMSSIDLAEKQSEEAEEAAAFSAKAVPMRAMSARMAADPTAEGESETTAAEEKNSGEIKVYHLDEADVVANEVTSGVEDDGNVVMVTNHFSIYIVAKLENLSESIQVTVQHWAPLDVLSADYPKTGKNDVTTNANIFAPSENNLELTEINGKRTLKHDRALYQIYSDDTFTFGDGDSLELSASKNKVLNNPQANYKVKNVYILKKSSLPNPDEKSDSDWDKSSENWIDITSLYNNNNGVELNFPTEADGYYGTPGTVDLNGNFSGAPYIIRFVYEAGDTRISNQAATFYDYNIRSYISGWSRKNYGINNEEQFSSYTGRSYKWLGLNGYPSDSYPDNYHFNHVYNKYTNYNADTAEHYNNYHNFVSSLDENGKIVYKDNVVDAGLFKDDAVNTAWRQRYTGYDLIFKRTGDTYILTGVKDEYDGNVVSGAENFTKRANKIWTNDFWALDTKDKNNFQSANEFDRNGHNWFYGMHYAFEFTLGDYTGPLTYCFCGDDDFWLFIDGELAVDLGGLHDPLGRKIDLYDFIDKEDKTTPHEIVIYYLERGGVASTCYMEFTIPNVTVLPPFEETEYTKLVVDKKWVDVDGNPLEEHPDSVSVTLKVDDEPYGNPVTLNASNNWSYTWSRLPKENHDYAIEETPVDGYDASYTNDGQAMYNPQKDQYEITITNRKKQSVAVSKKWVDSEEDSALVKAERPESVVTKLYWRQKGANGEFTEYKDAQGKPYTITLNARNSWTGIFTNLPILYNNAQQEAEYTVYEMNGASALKQNESLPSKTTNANYTVSYDTVPAKNMNQIKITNTLVKADLKLLKQGIDKDDTVIDGSLAGVTFTLVRTGEGVTWNPITTGEDGVAAFSGLPGGTYTLTETSAAPGYYGAGPWTVQVSADGIVTISGLKINESGQFVIQNKAGIKLPATGGNGTGRYTTAGIVIMLSAAFCLMMEEKKRRKEIG